MGNQDTKLTMPNPHDTDDKSVSNKALLDLFILLVVAFAAASATYVLEEAKFKKLNQEAVVTEAHQQAQQTLPTSFSSEIEISKDAHKVTLPTPSSVKWQDASGVNFSVTGIAIGNVNHLDAITKYTNNAKKPDDSVYGLVLNLKITTPFNYSYSCPALSVRLEGSEAGDLIAPLNRQYFLSNGGCLAIPGTTYYDQKIFFPVPSSQTEFNLRTGTFPNYIFNIQLKNDGSISVSNPKLVPDYFLQP